MADSAQSQNVYTYQDEDGRQHFVDSLDKIPPAFRGNASKPKDLPTLSRVPGHKLNKEISNQDRVVILVASWCGFCDSLENFLKTEKIAYKRYDIEKDIKGKKLYEKQGRGGVPITIVENKHVIRGFNPKLIIEKVRSKKPIKSNNKKNAQKT